MVDHKQTTASCQWGKPDAVYDSSIHSIFHSSSHEYIRPYHHQHSSVTLLLAVSGEHCRWCTPLPLPVLLIYLGTSVYIKCLQQSSTKHHPRPIPVEASSTAKESVPSGYYFVLNRLVVLTRSACRTTGTHHAAVLCNVYISLQDRPNPHKEQ